MAPLSRDLVAATRATGRGSGEGRGRGVDDPPLGRGYWGDTWLEVPQPPGTGFHNVLTGERVTVAPQGGRTGLAAGDVLATLPVALLERDAA